MDSIELVNALPKVFAGASEVRSGVWLRHVTLERGKKYLISAESGSGKSSLCAYIFGYRKDYCGEILFDGQNVWELTVGGWCDVRRRKISYLPQNLNLFPELTALENVELKNGLTGFKAEREIRAMFGRLGIGDKIDSPVCKLSIGQQQRVAVIRTLCQPCDFFLLDEPVSHLDGGNNRAVAAMITEEAERTGAGIIATSVGNNLEMEAEEVLEL